MGQRASSSRTRIGSSGRRLPLHLILDKLLLTTEHSPLLTGSHHSQFRETVTRRENIFIWLSRLCFSHFSFFAYTFPLFSSTPARIPFLPSVLPKAGAQEISRAMEKILNLEPENMGSGSETLRPREAFVFSSVKLSVTILPLPGPQLAVGISMGQVDKCVVTCKAT